MELAKLFLSIIEYSREYLFKVYMPLANDFNSTMTIIIILFFIITLITMIKTGNAGLTAQLFTTMFLLIIVHDLFFTHGLTGFKDWIYKPLYDSSFNLMNFFIDPFTKSIGVNQSYPLEASMLKLEELFKEMLNAATKQLDNNSWWNLFTGKTAMLGIVWMVLLIGFSIVVIGFLVFSLIGFMGFHILLVPAPIIIMFVALPMTRHIFTGWFKAVVTFALIPPFVGIAFGLVIMTLSNSVEDFLLAAKGGDPLTIDTLAIFFIYVLSFQLMKRAPEFASAITGGAITSLQGAGAVMMGAAAGAGAIYTQTKKDGALLGKGASGLNNFSKSRIDSKENSAAAAVLEKELL